MRRLKRFTTRRRELLFRMAAIILPLVGAVTLLSQTALAQNTYVITDGERVLVHTTATKDTDKVLDEAGLALGTEDSYTTQGNDGVSEITIRRIQTVHIDHCGQKMTVEAHGETIQALLDRLGIPVDDQTDVSASLEDLTYDGMELTVSRTVLMTEQYTKAVPFEVLYTEDSSMPAGTETVVVQGEDGEMVCTALVTYKDGVEADRKVIRQILSKPAVNEMIARGTADAAAEPDQRPDKAEELPVITDRTITLSTGEVLTYDGVLSVLASAYTNTDEGCDEWTATGTLARVGEIAVDPEVIPYGTRMFIISDDKEYVYGIATAEDCGGAIGGNRVDLYFDTTAECFQFGMRDCKVYFLT